MKLKMCRKFTEDYLSFVMSLPQWHLPASSWI